MRFSILIFVPFALLGCANQQEPVVEQISENSYRITAQGPMSEGKVAVENKIHIAARKVCNYRYYKFRKSQFGEEISIKGISTSSSPESWHDNHSSILEAVATISCSKD